jgi:hypothetical protein
MSPHPGTPLFVRPLYDDSSWVPTLIDYGVMVDARRHRSKWFGFAEPRAGARGRYHGSYRFNVFVGPGDYELRVLAKAETGYPFSAGTSNVVRVRVR